MGTGYIAHYHARAVKKSPNAELYAVCGRTRTSAKEFADQHSIEKYGNQVGLLTQDEDIDAILILTPNALHMPIAIQALESGKHVFLEKPAALNSQQTMEIQRISASKNLNVMVGHMWRFDEETRQLRNIIDSGILGQIVKTKGYGIHVNWGPSGWFTQQDLAGGGALIDMGVHAIDTVRYLLCDPIPLEVYAQLDTKYGDYDVDDVGVIFINWSCGTKSIVESGWWHPHSDGPEASTQVFGTKGYGNLFPTKYKIGDDDEMVILPKIEKSEHCDQSIYDSQMQQFITDIQEETISNPGIEEGLWVMKIVDAAYSSANTGKVVRLSE